MVLWPTMAKQGMAVLCMLTYHYKYLTLIQFEQVGRKSTATTS
jgi:hypothetical protein